VEEAQVGPQITGQNLNIVKKANAGARNSHGESRARTTRARWLPRRGVLSAPRPVVSHRRRDRAEEVPTAMVSPPALRLEERVELVVERVERRLRVTALGDQRV